MTIIINNNRKKDINNYNNDKNNTLRIKKNLYSNYYINKIISENVSYLRICLLGNCVRLIILRISAV